MLAAKKTLRYSELRRELTDITDTVLTSSLKSLIKNEIVSRKSYDEIPPKVEYSLTKKGASAVPILQSICKWAGAYHREGEENTLSQCRKCGYNGGDWM